MGFPGAFSVWFPSSVSTPATPTPVQRGSSFPRRSGAALNGRATAVRTYPMDASLPIHPDSAPSGRGVSPVLPVLRPKSRRAIVLVAFAVLYFALELGSSTQRSATYDEPLHLAAGYAALAQRDHRMDPSHPPFVRMWAALPLLGMAEVDYDDARIDPLPQEKSLPRQNTFAHDFLYGGHDADRLLNWGRFMIMLLGVLLGGLIFCWTEAWLGLPAAALALPEKTGESRQARLQVGRRLSQMEPGAAAGAAFESIAAS